LREGGGLLLVLAADAGSCIYNAKAASEEAGKATCKAQRAGARALESATRRDLEIVWTGAWFKQKR